jgi:hypothetical protein
MMRCSSLFDAGLMFEKWQTSRFAIFIFSERKNCRQVSIRKDPFSRNVYYYYHYYEMAIPRMSAIFTSVRLIP